MKYPTPSLLAMFFSIYLTPCLLEAQEGFEVLTDWETPGFIRNYPQAFLITDEQLYYGRNLSYEEYGGPISRIDLSTGSEVDLINVEDRFSGSGIYNGSLHQSGDVVFTRMPRADSGDDLYVLNNDDPGKIYSSPNKILTDLVYWGGLHYFLAYYDPPYSSDRRGALWQTDGTIEGTRMLEDLPFFEEIGYYQAKLLAGNQHLLLETSNRKYWAIDLATTTVTSLESLKFINDLRVGPTKLEDRVVLRDDAFYFSGEVEMDGERVQGIFRLNDNNLNLEEIQPGLFTGRAKLIARENNLLVSVLNRDYEYGRSYLYELTGENFSEINLLASSTFYRNESNHTFEPMLLSAYENRAYFSVPDSLIENHFLVKEYSFTSGDLRDLTELPLSYLARLDVADDVLYVAVKENEEDVFYRIRPSVLTVDTLRGFDGSNGSLYDTPSQLLGTDFYFFGEFEHEDGTSLIELQKWSRDEALPNLVVPRQEGGENGVFGVLFSYGDRNIVLSQRSTSDLEYFNYDRASSTYANLPILEDPLGGFFRPRLMEGEIVARTFDSSGHIVISILEENSFSPAKLRRGDGEIIPLEYFSNIGCRREEDCGNRIYFSTIAADKNLVTLRVEGDFFVADTLLVPDDRFFYINSETNLGYFTMYRSVINDGVDTFKVYDYNGVLQYQFNSKIFPYDIVSTQEDGVFFYGQDALRNGPSRWRYLSAATGQLLELEYIGFDNLLYDKHHEYYSKEGEILVIGANSTFGKEWYRIDAGSRTASLVHDIAPGVEAGVLDPGLMHNGIVYFLGFNETIGAELYRTDGTSAGTYLVEDLNPGPGYSEPRNLYVGEDFLFFSARGEVGFETYGMRLDGSEEILLMADVNPGGGHSRPANFVETEDGLYFRAKLTDLGANQLIFLPKSLYPEPLEGSSSNVRPPLIYPNPTSNLLHISAPAGEQLAHLKLYDQLGRLLISQDSEVSSMSLDLSSLPAANYWLRTTYVSGGVNTQAVQRAN